MAKDRARDIRRSVGSHEKMMGALGKAAGWTRVGASDEPKLTFAIQEDSPKFFAPGHGHVRTGTKDYYDHDRIATTESGPNSATKGLYQ
jgi:hypothetical protein